MKCPICFEGIHESWNNINQQIHSEDHTYQLSRMNCPQCSNDLIKFTKYEKRIIKETGFLIPLTQKQKPLPDFIPETFVKLYEESYSIMHLSSGASAALSRTCLQLLLRKYGKVKHGKLYDEIQQVIDSKNLPSELEDTINIIRENGNNATHPNKNDNPSEIILVDYEEAKWGLEILDSLFEHYIIKPHIQKKKLEEYEKKHPKKHV